MAPARRFGNTVLVTTTSRSRRSSAQVRGLITAAARDLFVEQGFENTSTAEIAERAGVIKAAVFRHFGTKESLFEHVVLEPLDEFVEQYIAQWTQADTVEESSRMATSAYVRGLLQLVRENRVLFTMLASVNSGDRFARSGHLARSLLDRHLVDLERRSRVQVEEHGAQVMDLALAVRFCTALVLGIALFEDTLFSAETPRPALDQLADELSAYVLRGTLLGP